MTPKEKALEIANKMYNGDVFTTTKQEHLLELENAKRCALLTVNEIINNSPSLPILGEGGTFGEDIQLSTVWWKEVKQEIEKL